MKLCVKRKTSFAKFGISEPTEYPMSSASPLGLNVGTGVTFITSGPSQGSVGLERLGQETEAHSGSQSKEG